ncbi:(d)CMP kinase [Thiospirillum jenense]|uniref:Cytidylate kinase n=1 Tax=Thiospirillum jenense TaxID=1653858 RepID=A0A839HEJ5_9GAMM|nr:(d)CMP kinase [Thiospirillum jenense]MBB1125607.1 (d)CMP kinase [Thiospirillum jenense]
MTTVDLNSSTQTAAPVITIDGPSGTGKGTIASQVALALGWHLLDSGALYRGLAVAALEAGVALDDGAALAALAGRCQLHFVSGQLHLNGRELGDQIRTEQVGLAASQLAQQPQVRAALLDWQRAAAQPPGLVADGRDMGSTVFPTALVKLYLDASAEERAQRRYKQLRDKGLDANLANLVEALRVRDAHDRERLHSPLTIPADAVVFDTTTASIAEVFAQVMVVIRRTLPAASTTV